MSQEICRLCLSNNNLSPIFVSLEQSEQYTSVLELTTGLKIEPDDELPQKICKNCTESVDSAINFRNHCHLAHKKLLHITKFNDNLPSMKNVTTGTGEASRNGMKHHFEDGTNDGDGRLPDFLVEVELQRMTDESSGSGKTRSVDGTSGTAYAKNCAGKGEKSTKEDGGAVTTAKAEQMTRKAKRNMYMELVDGQFDPGSRVTCKVCRKTVSKWSCFITHAKLHLGFKFMCEYCGKHFVSSTQLKRHSRSHHGLQREIACKQCSYLALDAAQLVLHERRVHTGVRPYVCDVCASSYHSRRCLLQHVESHRTTATVQCEQCPLKFKSARHLSRHRYNTHAGKRRKSRIDDVIQPRRHSSM